jgi:hypothetical protein
VVQFHFTWKQLSIIAGLAFQCCYFRLFTGSIKSAQVVLFLKALRKQLRAPLLIIWDGLLAHRSRLVRDYVDSTAGHIHLAFLPAYAPGAQSSRISVRLPSPAGLLRDSVAILLRCVEELVATGDYTHYNKINNLRSGIRYEPGGRGFKSCRARQYSKVYSGHIGDGLYRRHG